MSASKRSLDGRLAVVTGAYGVLGCAISKELAAEGADIRLVGRDSAKLSALANELGSITKASVCSIDLVNPTSEAIMAAVEGADILVNNAAVQGPIGPAWENDWDAWRLAVEVDLFAPVALARAAVVGMRNRSWGRIISVSGGGATGARPNFSSYAVAKTGLVRFTEVLAAELATSGVTVNAIAPGVFKSSLTADVVEAGNLSGVSELNIAQSLDPSSTGGTISKAAKLCAFLASDAAGGISGRLIAARWDDWENLVEHASELAASDLFTLRRITPEDRGLTWGSKP